VSPGDPIRPANEPGRGSPPVTRPPRHPADLLDDPRRPPGAPRDREPYEAPRTVTATGTIPRVRLPEWPPEEIDAPPALHHEYVGDWGYQPIVPERMHGGAGVFLRIVTIALLLTSVELWWLDTPAHSVDGVAAALTESGRITGMVAGFLLLVQVLLMSRVGWLERWIGANDLLLWHRELGGTLLVVVLAHVALITFGYAGESGVSVFAQTGDLWSHYPAMISAYVATGILVLVGVLAIRSIRRRMPYELWYYVHLSSYLVLLWSYGHQFAAGQELSRGGFGHWYWVALYAFVVVCLCWGRIVLPLRLNLRHRLRVAEVVAEGGDMVSIYITGRRIEDLDVRAGQFFRWRFMARGCWWQAHPFSLSAAPNGRWLRLTVKVVGDHTSDLAHLRPGVRIFAEGPWGIFTAERRRHPGALLIAGGSGIAPIRALLEELPAGTIVLYRARSMDEVIFKDELEWLARQRRAHLWYVLGGRDDEGPRRAFSARGMRELAPDVRRRDVYLCGPAGLVDASRDALRRLRVSSRQIHMDPFEY
jgi:predicted ferric reductase